MPSQRMQSVSFGPTNYLRSAGTVLLLQWCTRPIHGERFIAHHTLLSRHHHVAFAAGGFGRPKDKKKSKKKTKATRPTPRLQTADGRMEYIQSRIQKADFSPMNSLVLMDGDSPVVDMDPNAICVIDDFLGADFISSMRREAESIFPIMVPSQSTLWDEEKQCVIPYEKYQVMSTQIEGGAEGYAASPRLVEYIVTLTTHLSARLNAILPDTHHLSTTEQTNKLAVCMGDGSKYDKHIDNGGGLDRRKLTALLYLQPPDWVFDGSYPSEEAGAAENSRGGYFRAYDVPEKQNVTWIAPRGDRLLLFWSDSLVHDVSPSFAPAGMIDRRWALTVWFVVDQDGVIRQSNSETTDRHFGMG